MANKLRLEGFPTACNKIKADLFIKKSASRHGITLAHVDFKGTYAELTFVNEGDIDKYVNNLEAFYFAGLNHTLKALVIKERQCERNDASDGITPSLLPLMSVPTESPEEIPGEEDHFFDAAAHENWLPTVIQFSKAHTWFDLELSTEQNRIALLVQSHDKNIGHPELQKYFESKESNGGPVERMILMIDGVLMTFRHAKTTENIMSKKIHKIEGKQIKLFRKVIPELFRDQLILVNSKTNSLPETEMIMEIGNLSPDSPQPKNIVPSELENVFEVVYEESLGQREFQDLLENAKAKEFDADFQIRPLPKTDCIIVEGLSKGIELRRLRIHLENKAFTGGATVTRMDRTKNGPTLVYFVSFKEVENVIERYGDKGLTILESSISVKPYFHCLSNLHEQLENEHNLDAYSRTMLDKEVAPMSFEFEEANSDIVKFISSRRRHFQKLRDDLTDIANVEVLEDSGNARLKITPISVQVAKDQVDFKERCIPKLKTFFMQFESKKHRDFKLENLEKVREANLYRILHTDGMDEEDNDYAIRWTGLKGNVVVVTGLTSVIDSTIQRIVSFADISNKTLSMSKGKYRWLIELRGWIQAMTLHQCEIKRDDANHSLLFTGNKTDTSDAYLHILKSIEPLICEKFDSLNKDHERFLTNSSINKRVVKYVNAALKHLSATFIVEDGAPYIWCHEGKMHSATAALRKILVTEKIQYAQGEFEAMKLEEWKGQYNDLADKYLVEISIQDLTIIIVGFEDQIGHVKNGIRAYLDDHAIQKEGFPIMYGKALYIMKFCNELKECKDLVEHGFERGEIFVKGKKRAVEKVLGILKKQNIVEGSLTRKFFKILDYFVSGDGKKEIKEVRSNHKCIILLEEEIPCMKDESKQESSPENTASKNTSPPVPKTGRGTNPLCEVLKGDITMNQSIAIVNPIGNHFVLHKGGLVCSAIAKRGGDTVQSELKTASGKFIRVTSSGKLPSMNIIHADFSNDAQTMEKRLQEVLQIAEERQFRTIGIPAIGTGNMHLPPSAIAQVMHNAFEAFKTSTVVRYLQKIEIVIFDEKVLPAFEEVFRVSASGYEELHASGGASSSNTSQTIPSPNNSTAKHLKSTITIGPFTVTVRRGDITQENSDAIVNSVSTDFNLTKGLVSKQILKKGGDDIQKELSAASGKIMRVTKSGKLPCAKIIHVVFPNTEDKMRKCIEEIIGRAEEENCASLSLPAIGTGNLALASSAIAKLIREAMERYGSNHSITQHLKKIDIVVFDEPKLDAFLKEIILLKSEVEPIARDISSPPQVDPISYSMTAYGRMREMLGLGRKTTSSTVVSEQQQTSSPLHKSGNATEDASVNSVIMGSIKLTVTKGDITKEKVDAIVNSTGPKFDLSQGQVSQIIIKKGGHSIQKELSAATGDHLRVTNGGKLACGKIIHAVFPNDSGAMKQRVKEVLARADAEMCKTLSLPAVGTGNLNLPSNSIAKLLQEALKEFTSSGAPTKHLNEINVVIYDDTKFSDFLSELITVPKSAASGAIPKKNVLQPQDGNMETKVSNSRANENNQEGKSSLTPVPAIRRYARILQEAWTEQRISSDSPDSHAMPNSRNVNSVTIYFYCAKKEKIAKVKRAIDRHISLVFGEETFVISNLDDIGMWKSNALKEILSVGNVGHSINEDAKKITISGKKEDVTNARVKIEQLAKELETKCQFQTIAPFSWKYCNSNGDWIEFSPLASTDTEEAFIKKKQATGTIHLDIEGKMMPYVANFKKMEIQSADSNHSFQYRIRRDLREELPRHWDNMDEDELFKQVKLDETSAEYFDVKSRFEKTVHNCKIQSISRIQNKKLYFRYRHEKRRVERTMTSSKEIERVLFHGTSADIGDKIAVEGFDRGYKGANAVYYGDGVYFAKNASYSNSAKYAKPNAQKVKTILVANVITGDFCLGKQGMKSAPPKKQGSAELYNCAVNNIDDPVIFVVFVDAGAYPEYMIKYTE